MRGGRHNSPLVTPGGFSLIEITVALAVMSILAAIAIPHWSKLLPVYQLDSSARQVQSELNNIKMRAAAENNVFQLKYSDGASSYTIQRDSKALVIQPMPKVLDITKAGKLSF